jgi:saccharopepsin
MSESTGAFQTYQSKTGSTLDSATGLLSITSAQYSSLQSLTFNIGGNSYDLTPNGQIWPRSLNVAIGGNSTSVYLIVGDIGSVYGSGLDFVNGYTFLYVYASLFFLHGDREVLYLPPSSERYYSVYDTTNGQVGFASTAYTESTSN